MSHGSQEEREVHELFFQERFLFFRGQDLVHWYQRMMRDVHQEVSLGKLLQSELA